MRFSFRLHQQRSAPYGLEDPHVRAATAQIRAKVRADLAK